MSAAFAPTWTPENLFDFVKKECEDHPERVKVRVEIPFGTHSEVREGTVTSLVHGKVDWVIEIRSEGMRLLSLCTENSPCIEIVETCQVVKRHEPGTCPRCGDDGEWRGLGLVCRNGHGVFAG